MTTIGDEISSGGGGGGYTLPTASAETKGGIKIGNGLSMSGEVLNNTNPTAYTLPTASAETKGGIKVGSNLSIDENGVLSATAVNGEVWDTLWTNPNFEQPFNAASNISLVIPSGSSWDNYNGFRISYALHYNYRNFFIVNVERSSYMSFATPQLYTSGLYPESTTKPHVRIAEIEMASSGCKVSFSNCYAYDDLVNSDNAFIVPFWLQGRRVNNPS